MSETTLSPEVQEMLLAQGKTFVWHQLFAPSVQGALDFYSQALEWGVTEYPMGDMGTYHMLIANGRPVAGVVSTESAEMDGAAPHWSIYIGVDQVDARIQKCTELGARLVSGPMDVPTVGRMALMQDPQGATFWLFQPEM